MKTNSYENYVVVMLANGMHLTGELFDPTSAGFGRVEIRDVMILNFQPNGDMALGMHPLGDSHFTVYPIVILKFSDIPKQQHKGITNAYRQKHGQIQLVSQ